MSLFRHNIKVAVRNLLKYRLQTIVSIVSLSLGMVFFSLTALWLRYERSFDAFYEDVDDMYLLTKYDDYHDDYGSALIYSMPEIVANNNPSIESFCRITQERWLNLSDMPEETVRGRWIDGNFQDFFNVKVIEGDSRLDLHDNEIAITESCANRLFGGNAIGKQLNFPQQANDAVPMDYYEMIVKAIIEDPRQPSTFKYDFLAAYGNRDMKDNYLSTLAFVKVSPENRDSLASRLAKDWYRRDLADNSYTYDVGNFRLVPMKEVRKTASLDSVMVRYSYVRLFMLLSIIMIICALANYYTMLATRIGIRIREISLRLANGARPFQIISMFSTEILLALLVSMVIGMVVCVLGLRYFKTISLIEQAGSFFILSYLLYSLFVGIVALLIASVIVAATGKRQLNRSLGKGGTTSSTAGYRLSIGFQLAVSICAVFCAVVMTSQVHYLTNSKDMGYRKKNIAFILQRGMNEGEAQTALARLQAIPEIENVVYGGFKVPTWNFYSASSMTKRANDYLGHIEVVEQQANREYLDLLEVRLLAGELFDSLSYASDQKNNVIIGENAVLELGYSPDEAIGKTLYLGMDHPKTIIGVITDFCFAGPTSKVNPLVFTYSKDGNDNWRSRYPGFDHEQFGENVFLFRYRNGLDWQEVTAKASAAIQEIKSDAFLWPMDMEYMYTWEHLSSELTLSKFLTIVTIICIVIAICGVFSIVSLACERRRKEIAVRKINGAHARDIAGMFLKEYMTVLAVAAVVAFPIGYLIMHRWLSVYAKQVTISVWMFLAIFVSMACLMAATVIRRIRVASRQDPAVVVKNE